jgi:ABC-2 type transport system ATP-binding protein
MSEMEHTADHLIVIGRGRLIADTDMSAFMTQASTGAPVRVRSPQLAQLTQLINQYGAHTDPMDDGAIQVSGLTAERIGELAAGAQIVLHELTPLQVSLEDAFMSVTKDSVEYHELLPSGAAAGSEAAA